MNSRYSEKMIHTEKDLFKPITAQPFRKSDNYTELLPHPVLRPFLRCFWNSQEIVLSLEKQKIVPKLIIPDACMDILFEFDDFNQCTWSCFCSVDEVPHFSHPFAGSGKRTLFGIRFYSWTVSIFTKEKLNGRKGVGLEVEEFFPQVVKELLPLLSLKITFEEKAAAANQYFLKKLDEAKIDFDLMNLSTEILHKNARSSVKEIASGLAMSERQAERKFREKIGVSPKSLISLIRYQLVWQDILKFSGRANILDLVEKYNFYDQAHLLNDFKKHHGMNISEALQYSSV